MGENANQTRAIQFGVYEVDLQAGELRKHGLRVRIQDLPFRVLVTLLENPRRVVTRDQLREKLWGSETFVDFDRSLNTAIAKLREALGDSAENPRFVETLPRRGYRFLADVKVIGPAGLTDPASELAPGMPPTPEDPDRRETDDRDTAQTDPGNRRIGPLILVAGVAAAAVVLIAVVWLSTDDTQSAGLVAVPLTSYPGRELSPTFSPDGSEVAFAWNGRSEDNFDIYRKVIGSVAEEPLRLTNDSELDYCPSWSPDGKTVAFLRRVRQHGPSEMGEVDIILVSPLGVGVERNLARIRPGLTSVLRCSPPAWSPDGKWLATPDRPSPDSSPGLFSISVETREKRRITTGADHFPAYAPDGRSLAFSRGVGITGDLFAVDISNGSEPVGEPRRLTFRRQRPFHPAWLPDGRGFVFRVATGTMAGLLRIRIPGKGGPVRLPTMAGRTFHPALSRSGNRLAYAASTGIEDIVRVPMPGAEGKNARPIPFASSSRREANPRYSPDGRRVAFSSSRSGSSEIWVCDSDGLNAVQLTRFGKMHCGSPRWSPDGTEIIFNSAVSGYRDVFRLPADGGQPVRVTDRAGLDGDASWSRDGKWIYFMSDRTGEAQIWKVAADGGEPAQVTREGGVVGVESPDGTSVYYAKRSAPWSIWRVPRDGGDEEEVITSVWCQHCFCVRPKGIYFIDGAGNWASRWDYNTAEVTQVLQLEEPRGYGFDVSPDGRWVLHMFAEGTSDLMLVENFR